MRCVSRALLLFTLALAGCAPMVRSMEAEHGALDLSGDPAALQSALALGGEWSVWWGQLLEPGQLDAIPPTGLMQVPRDWTDAPLLPGGLPAFGVATMRLTVALPPGVESLGVQTDSVAVAHRLWVNGVERRGMGVVGLDPDREVPDIRSRLNVVANPGETLEIVLQISNHHHREGGLRKEVQIGPPEVLISNAQRLVVQDMVGMSTLLVSGLYFLVIFRMRPRHWSTLYFALFCLDLALRSSSSGGAQVLALLVPDLPWSAMLRMEYTTSYLGLGLGALMLGTMFPKDAPWRWLRLAVALSGGLVALVFLAPMSIYTRSLPVFQVGAVALMIVFLVELLRATRNRRPLARLTLAGVVVFNLGVVHDILQSNHLISTPGEISSLTLFLFLFAQGWGHAREFSRSYDTIEQLSQNLLASNADLEGTNRAVQRFVPYAFIDLLKKATIKDVQRGDHVRREMGILFCDLRGFTTLVEGLEPERAFDFINRYLTVMEPPIHAHGGFINQYLGDCIMALFPGELDRALAGALTMLAALRAWNVERLANGEGEVLVGVGLSAGPLMLGTIGGMDRLDNGVIGDAVNRSARLEGLTKLYDTVMITDEHLVRRLRAPEAARLRPLDRVVLKGKVEPVRLYEVLGALPPEVEVRRQASLDTFQRGLQCWERGALADAREAFDAVLAQDPADGPARRMVRRCAEQSEPLPPGWTGVTALAEK